jgi:hypothetical protein
MVLPQKSGKLKEIFSKHITATQHQGNQLLGRCAFQRKITDVSEEHNVCIFMVEEQAKKILLISCLAYYLIVKLEAIHHSEK